MTGRWLPITNQLRLEGTSSNAAFIYLISIPGGVFGLVIATLLNSIFMPVFKYSEHWSIAFSWMSAAGFLSLWIILSRCVMMSLLKIYTSHIRTLFRQSYLLVTLLTDHENQHVLKLKDVGISYYLYVQLGRELSLLKHTRAISTSFYGLSKREGLKPYPPPWGEIDALMSYLIPSLLLVFFIFPSIAALTFVYPILPVLISFKLILSRVRIQAAKAAIAEELIHV